MVVEQVDLLLCSPMPFLSRGFCHGKYTFTLFQNIHSAKPDLNEIVKFMCQLAAILSELLTPCDSINL